MKANRLTVDQLRTDSERNFNPQLWERRINDVLQFSDVQFYKVDKGNGYDYDRFFVSYTLPEGLRVFSEFGYSTSLIKSGFQEVVISDFIVSTEGEVKIEQLPENVVNITTLKARFADGTEGLIDNTDGARQMMAERSEKYGSVWTNCL